MHSSKPRVAVGGTLAALAALGLATVGLAMTGAPARAEDDAVTTTWAKDPFPNLPPKALDRAAVVEAGSPARTPSVLLGVYDVENDELSVASFTRPAHGSVTKNADGKFTYSPRRGYTGEDSFRFTIADARGARSTATMNINVTKPAPGWSATSFTGLAPVEAGGEAISFGGSALCARAADFDGDGRTDILVAVDGAVWWYRNAGTAREPRFAPGARVRAGGAEVKLGGGRVAISWVDVDSDGRRDLVAVPADDRKVRLMRNVSARGAAGPADLAAPEILRTRAGGDLVAEDVRADVADLDGDGRPDIVTGSFSGAVRFARNAGGAAGGRVGPVKDGSAPVFEAATTKLDTGGLEISGSYNLNARVADLDRDGLPDLVVSYNWGNVDFYMNGGSAGRARLGSHGRFSVTGPGHAAVNLHALCDGGVVDFADLNGDGSLDMVVGCERGGKVHMAFGVSARSYLADIRAMVEAHPRDLGAWLADEANSAAKTRMQSLQGGLYDYVTSFASPGQRREIARELTKLVRDFPQYFRHAHHDIKQEPGIAALAVQTWLTLLMTDYLDPAARKAVADAAGMTGGYRKLVEDSGLVYADNAMNPRGAEAIHQWLRTIPREVYPGNCITANDWLGGRTFLVRGHTKNTFNGAPVDNGEYGFGGDARRVIGDRGSENWFMTVVRHEACHDVDAYVRRSPDMNRRWGQVLVLAGGPDMRADPATGWLSWDLTKTHFREAGLWDGEAASWNDAWKKYWTVEPGKGWRDFGFMRGSIDWFYGAPQESLATQGNQFWNSTEGRIEVAIDRFRRGYRSNLTEVLMFMDVWSVGLEKMKFYEVDNASRQSISFARLGRTREGYIDRVDLGDRRYEFAVDAKGVVTDVLHAPGMRVVSQPPGEARGAISPLTVKRFLDGCPLVVVGSASPGIRKERARSGDGFVHTGTIAVSDVVFGACEGAHLQFRAVHMAELRPGEARVWFLEHLDAGNQRWFVRTTRSGSSLPASHLPRVREMLKYRFDWREVLARYPVGDYRLALALDTEWIAYLGLDVKQVEERFDELMGRYQETLEKVRKDRYVFYRGQRLIPDLDIMLALTAGGVSYWVPDLAEVLVALPDSR